jgi:hypothetical protein
VVGRAYSRRIFPLFRRRLALDGLVLTLTVDRLGLAGVGTDFGRATAYGSFLAPTPPRIAEPERMVRIQASSSRASSG